MAFAACPSKERWIRQGLTGISRFPFPKRYKLGQVQVPGADLHVLAKEPTRLPPPAAAPPPGVQTGGWEGGSRADELLLTQRDGRLLRDIDDDFLEALYVADPIQQWNEEIQTLGGEQGKLQGKPSILAPEQRALSWGAQQDAGSAPTNWTARLETTAWAT